MEQVELDFIVAHEIAHALLAHEQSVGDAEAIEEEADALALT
jgi:Zn-dependent peptidase ImmA (M78 family)